LNSRRRRYGPERLGSSAIVVFAGRKIETHISAYPSRRAIITQHIDFRVTECGYRSPFARKMTYEKNLRALWRAEAAGLAEVVTGSDVAFWGPQRHFAAPNNNVASLIGHSGSSAFRLSTTIVSMSLTGSCFSSESAPRPLYGAFLVKRFK
jgi:hypothetical protein